MAKVRGLESSGRLVLGESGHVEDVRVSLEIVAVVVGPVLRSAIGLHRFAPSHALQQLLGGSQRIKEMQKEVK
jgi:hypothetical protein